MASVHKHLRSSTASKRPTASGLADGQLAICTASGTPAVFFKDNASGVVKVGPAHVGPSAPNVIPAGSAGNSLGEFWVDNSTTTPGLKYYTGSAFANLTPSGTTTTVGLVELATDAETQAGTDTVRAVTPSGLQSKVSDSVATTSSTTIASATAVKTAYDIGNAALPRSGGTMDGVLTIGSGSSIAFEGSADDSFETTLTVVNPTADRTITFPNITGTVITSADNGTVTSGMILDGTIGNAKINASAAIAYSKLAAITSGTVLIGNESGVPTGRAITGDVTVSISGVTAITAGSIVNADINASAAVGVSKLANGTARQLLQTNAAGSGVEWASNIDIPGTLDVTGAATFDSSITAGTIVYLPSGTAIAAPISIGSGTTYKPGIYSPTVDSIAFTTSGVKRVEIDTAGNMAIGGANTETQYDFSGNPYGPQLVVSPSGVASSQIQMNSQGEWRLNFGDGVTSDRAGILVQSDTWYTRLAGGNKFTMSTNAASLFNGPIEYSHAGSTISSDILKVKESVTRQVGFNVAWNNSYQYHQVSVGNFGTSGSVGMPGYFTAPTFYTGEELDYIPASAATTIFSLPYSATDKYGTFIITAYLTGGNVTDWITTVLVHTYNNTAHMTTLKSASGVVLSLSGMNVQCTQNSAGFGFVFSTVTRLMKGFL